jgi:hypothetical protein
MPDLRVVIHFAIHLLAPGLLARLAFKPRWLSAWALMMVMMIVDVDHLFADPIYDPNRCSVGFHPLHSWPAIGGYTVLLLLPLARVPAAGLLVHMGTDSLDCLWMHYL